MEVEKTVHHINGEGKGAEPVDRSADAIEDLIDEHKAENTPGGKNDTLKAKTLSDETEEKDKSPEKETSAEEKPSKRVQEGQKWNNRHPRYNNKIDRAKYKNNIKSDLTSQIESSDPVAIRKQVEFYFSDSNLLQDKFLFTKVEGHENLPVPISIIHSFKRMRHFQPLSAIVDALKESTTLNVVEDDSCVQRKEPLPEGLVGKPMIEIQKVHEDKSMARSIYAKGFGDEEPSTQFDIEAFFAKFGQTNLVRLRRAYDQSFKGSVFVEFDSEETQKSFLALDPKPKWQGKDLQIKSKKQYCDDKVDDIKAGKVRPNEHDDRSKQQFKHNFKRRRESNDHDGGGKGGKSDDRDWRERREEDRKSGFRNKNNGKHRGFGSSGRGRGGRDGRGHKDRNNERDDRDDRGVPRVRATTLDSSNEASTLENTQTEKPKQDQESLKVDDNVPQSKDTSVKVSEGAPTTISDTTETISSVEPSTKKRAREEDEAPDGVGSSKRMDTKDVDA